MSQQYTYGTGQGLGSGWGSAGGGHGNPYGSGQASQTGNFSPNDSAGGGSNVNQRSSQTSNHTHIVSTGLQPKAMLAGWYGKMYRQLLAKDDYHCWHDGGLPHQLKFTAVFVNPLTGEVWPSGRYGDPQNYCVRTDPRTKAPVIWYSKKTFSEHAAAARAYDCLMYRECKRQNKQLESQLAIEEPYMRAVDAPRLPTLPFAIEAKISEVQGRVGLMGRTDAATQPLHGTGTPVAHAYVPSETAAQRDREDYRKARFTQDSGDPKIKREEDMQYEHEF